ncbi:asparagine synthase [Proteiniborus sp. MB09-C3]|uniref:asparagine synthase n=1 Tax=Proteiniborus sp. MB09-C3 TaxID=3050072 RepID=UPI002553F801|nr:asparagine synthase [Proteiniborus sp. MB09-C3]WIV13974.1 asparagine synthase [Proteiniborus sp. MB09-C3]
MREGLIPMLLGVAVTGAALTARALDIKKRGIEKDEIAPMIATGLIGFGLAHIVLGGIDLIQER